MSQSTATVVKDFGGVKVHSFVAPYEIAANATHIVETEHALVVVDTQFVAPMAAAFRAYADALNKPIERVFVSHGHPDHYFGLALAFADHPGCSIPEVNTIIEEWGPQMVKNQKPRYGDRIPDAVKVPTQTVVGGEAEVIDGLRYEYDVVRDAESEIQLNIRLPEIGVHIVQDLIYSGVHLWLGMGQFARWAAELQQVLDRPDYHYYLPGHGLPCGKDEVAHNRHYLEHAARLYAAGPSAPAFRAQLIEAFPYRQSPMMFDLYLSFLFPDPG